MSRILHGPGWIHEDDESGEASETAASALINYLRHVRGNCDDQSEDREIAQLDNVEHVVYLMELRTLKSEEQREADMVGLDDDEHMADLPIGGTYCHEAKRMVYVTTIQQFGDDNAGTLTISYTRKVRDAK